MEFTDATKGDRATIHPSRLAIASHHGNGVWHVNRLPDLQPWCVVHSGSAEARPMWHDRLPRLLFYTTDSVVLFDLTGRSCGDGDGEGEGGRQPNMPDGVIKEARTVRIQTARFLSDHRHIVVLLENQLGVRVWSVERRHEPVLSTGSHVFITNDMYCGVVVDKAFYVLESKTLSVVDKWRLPEGALLQQFVFLTNRHHCGRYGIMAWQCDEQVWINC